MKYNNTLEKFKSILDNTKYSNLYNYCGVPSYLNNSNNSISQTINNQTAKNESKIENVKNETNTTVNNQTEKSSSVTQKEIQSLQNSTKEKETKIIENKPNNLSNLTKNRTNLLKNNDTLIEKYGTNRKNQGKNLAKQDMNFYNMTICSFVIIVSLIAFVIFFFILRKNRRKRYTKFKETVAKKENPKNISVMTSNDSVIKSGPQSNVLNLNTFKKII